MNYFFYGFLVGCFLDADEKDMLYRDFEGLCEFLGPFTRDILRVHPPFDLTMLLRTVCLHSLHFEKGFHEFDEEQNKAVYAVQTLLKKLSNEHGQVLREKFISVELMEEKCIERIDFKTKKCEKILERVNNSWILADVWPLIEGALGNYKETFKDCYNKLKTIIQLSKVVYRLR